MLEKRKVVVIGPTGHVVLQTQPMPDLQPGQILVRVYASLISPGTELGPYRGRDRQPGPVEKYRSFGYGNAGEIIALGDGVRSFEVGQRVACMGGGYAAHADYACVPQHLAVQLPDAVHYEEGAFVALAATAMHAARRGEVVFGEEVGIVGLGLVGQLTAQVCAQAGARVQAFDSMPVRVSRAHLCGIDLAAPLTGEDAVRQAMTVTGGSGLDCAFIAFGGEATAALQDITRMMKLASDTHRWGRVVIVGGAQINHGFGAALGNLDLRSAARTGPGYHDEAYEHGAGYPPVFVRWPTDAHLRLFVRWVEEKKLRLKELITDHVPAENAAEGCYALMDAPGDHLGVVIHYEH